MIHERPKVEDFVRKGKKTWIVYNGHCTKLNTSYVKLTPCYQGAYWLTERTLQLWNKMSRF